VGLTGIVFRVNLGVGRRLVRGVFAGLDPAALGLAVPLALLAHLALAELVDGLATARRQEVPPLCVRGHLAPLSLLILLVVLFLVLIPVLFLLALFALLLFALFALLLALSTLLLFALLLVTLTLSVRIRRLELVIAQLGVVVVGAAREGVPAAGIDGDGEEGGGEDARQHLATLGGGASTRGGGGSNGRGRRGGGRGGGSSRGRGRGRGGGGGRRNDHNGAGGGGGRDGLLLGATRAVDTGDVGVDGWDVLDDVVHFWLVGWVVSCGRGGLFVGCSFGWMGVGGKGIGRSVG
jgi:hypothetical protein